MPHEPKNSPCIKTALTKLDLEGIKSPFIKSNIALRI